MEMKDNNGDVLLELKVNPNCSEFSIEGFNNWTGRLEVKLSEPAEKGKANKELLEKMGDFLNKDTVLKSGKKSRKKTLLVRNASRERLEEEF